MSLPTYERLVAVQSSIEQALEKECDHDGEVGSVFVPWIGRAARVGGLYFVGIGLDANAAVEGQTFEQSLSITGAFCGPTRHDRSRTPFWSVFDKMTLRFLGGPYEATSDRWGWSNLLKIGWSKGSPSGWPPKLVNLQAEACAAAFAEEIAGLSRSLIFVGSGNDYGILDSKVAPLSTWSQDREEAGFWWWHDKATGNLFVHSNHPRKIRQGGGETQLLRSLGELASQYGLFEGQDRSS
jgi:hypothetical protein